MYKVFLLLIHSKVASFNVEIRWDSEMGSCEIWSVSWLSLSVIKLMNEIGYHDCSYMLLLKFCDWKDCPHNYVKLCWLNQELSLCKLCIWQSKTLVCFSSFIYFFYLFDIDFKMYALPPFMLSTTIIAMLDLQ